MMTAWGYEIVESLCPLITMDDFHERTNLAYLNNPRAEAALLAASQAIRNYCGWHIAPSVSCVAYPNGGDKVLRLPAGYVSSIVEVKEHGETVDPTAYEWRRDGLVRKKGPCGWSSSWDGLEVYYKAGFDALVVPDLAEAVCAITAGVLAVSAGVTSESADGVSISYASSASSIAAGLTLSQKAALDAYKVVTSHGA